MSPCMRATFRMRRSGWFEWVDTASSFIMVCAATFDFHVLLYTDDALSEWVADAADAPTPSA